MKSCAPSFERLEQIVTMIARHVDYLGKDQVVAGCLDDIDDRWRQRQLTLDQRLQLYAILLRGPDDIGSSRQPSDPERKLP
jgi:hypothetical protein